MKTTCRFARRSLKRAGFIIRNLSVFFLFFLPGITYGQWVQKADELYQTAEGNNIVYNNKLYVFGGFSKNPVIEKRNEVYDPATNTWTAIAPFPAGKEITHNGIILVDDKVWIIGGRAVDSHGPVSNQVIIYNITTNKWTNGPGIIDPATGKAFPLGGGGYALLGRTIHVFGGFGPTICEDQATLHLTIDVDKYMADPDHITWENNLAPMPIPRNHISYITLGGKIYALGGQFKHDCGANDQKYCHVYDPNTDKWTRLTDLPKVRSHAEASSFALDGKILLVAGQGLHDIPQNTVYEFDPNANNKLGGWTDKTNYRLPGNFLGLSSKILANKFIITNGAKDNYANSRKETYSFTVGRSATRTLGFGSSSVNKTIDTGGIAVFKNLLFVIQDSVKYKVASNQKWLSITKNITGTVTLNGKEIEFAVNGTGLSPGKYTGQLTATGVNTAASATFNVNLVVASKNGYTITVDTIGSGTVTKTPNKASYLPGDVINITAKANTGWKFNRWNGDTTTSNNPLTFSIKGDKSITAEFVPDDDPTWTLITNIISTTADNYALSNLTSHTKYYTDRDYLLNTIPAAYNKLPSIKTANDDKNNDAANTLSFTLTAAATVYIAYDPRATVLPAWLSGWQKLTDQLSIADPKLASFNIYSKKYDAGTVTLGGNLQSPAKGALCGYIVFTKATTGSESTLANAQKMVFTATYSDVTSQQLPNSTTQTKLMLYPNPAHDSFNITLPENFSDLAEAIIVNVFGKAQRIPSSSISLTGNTLVVNTLPLQLKPGLHSVRITSKKGVQYFAKVLLQ